MERPNIKEFFPDKTVEEMHLIYRNAETLFSYVKELDKYIDELESRPVQAVVSVTKGDPIRATLNIELEIPDYEKVLLRAKEWMIKHKYKYSEDETCSLITDYLMSDVNIGYGIINQELYVGEDASPLSR